MATTDRTGRLRVGFRIPGSSPGIYSIVAEEHGVPVARAAYLVVSHARLSVVTGVRGGAPYVSVRGEHFVPNIRLVLILIPLDRQERSIMVGHVESDETGGFVYARSMRTLRDGQYALRAVSTSQVSAQMAETFVAVTL